MNWADYHEQVERIEADITAHEPVEEFEGILTKTEKAKVDELIKEGCEPRKLKNYLVSLRGTDLGELDNEDMIREGRLLPDEDYDGVVRERLAKDSQAEWLKQYGSFGRDSLPSWAVEDMTRSPVYSPNQVKIRHEQVMDLLTNNESGVIDKMRGEILSNPSINRLVKEELYNRLGDCTHRGEARRLIKEVFPKGLPK